MTIIVALNSVGTEPNTLVLAMWSEDFKKSTDIQVTKGKLAAMKQKKKYKFVEWTELPPSALTAEIMQKEEDLE